MLDIQTYRKGNEISKLLYDDKTSIKVKDTVYAVVPTRYKSGRYLEIGKTVNTIGILLLLDGKGNGQLMLKPSLVEFVPSAISYDTVNGVDYLIMEFRKGDTLVKLNDLIISPDIMGWYFNDAIIKNNNIPYFMGYYDLMDLFVNAVGIGDKIAKRPADMGVLISVIAKDASDKPLRFSTNKDIATKPVVWNGLSNVSKTLNTPMSLLTGSYLNKGLTKLVASGDLEASDLEMLMQ